MHLYIYIYTYVCKTVCVCFTDQLALTDWLAVWFDSIRFDLTDRQTDLQIDCGVVLTYKLSQSAAHLHPIAPPNPGWQQKNWRTSGRRIRNALRSRLQAGQCIALEGSGEQTAKKDRGLERLLVECADGVPLLTQSRKTIATIWQGEGGSINASIRY